jgi:hypothetical protein
MCRQGTTLAALCFSQEVLHYSVPAKFFLPRRHMKDQSVYGILEAVAGEIILVDQDPAVLYSAEKTPEKSPALACRNSAAEKAVREVHLPEAAMTEAAAAPVVDPSMLWYGLSMTPEVQQTYLAAYAAALPVAPALNMPSMGTHATVGEAEDLEQAPSEGFDDSAEDKHLRRMRRNRDSAALSRHRKKQHVENLESQVASLQEAVRSLIAQNQELRSACMLAQSGAAGAAPGDELPADAEEEVAPAVGPVAEASLLPIVALTTMQAPMLALPVGIRPRE